MGFSFHLSHAPTRYMDMPFYSPHAFEMLVLPGLKTGVSADAQVVTFSF